MIVGFKSLAELWDVHTRLGKNAEMKKKSEEWQSGPEPAFESQANTLLEATEFSPELVADKEPAKRSASSNCASITRRRGPNWRRCTNVSPGPRSKSFHRSGVHPVLYSSTLFGPNMPNLTYLIPFDNLDAREKAWAKFGADPEWQKVRKESIDKHGQISSIIQISLFKATAYSPVG